MKKPPAYQNSVRAFDKKHWMHAPGPDSIEHTCLHLMSTVGRTVASCDSRWRWNDLYLKQLPGCLIEHAFRIANNSRMRIEFHPGNPITTPLLVSIKEHNNSVSQDPISIVPPEGPELFLDLMTKVGTLATVCERLDHGITPHRADKQKLFDVVRGLLDLAGQTGPLSRTQAVREEDVVQLYLQPLHNRLRDLEFRQASGQFNNTYHTP